MKQDFFFRGKTFSGLIEESTSKTRESNGKHNNLNMAKKKTSNNSKNKSIQKIGFSLQGLNYATPWTEFEVKSHFLTPLHNAFFKSASSTDLGFGQSSEYFGDIFVHLYGCFLVIWRARLHKSTLYFIHGVHMWMHICMMACFFLSKMLHGDGTLAV